MQRGVRAERSARIYAEVEEAALRLFDERGYHATTVTEIAEAAGVSRRTVFRYFETKEDLLYAHHAREHAVLDAALDAADGDADEILVTVMLEFARAIHEEGDGLEVRARIVGENPELLDRAMRARGQWETRLAREIARKRGEPEPSMALSVRSASALAAVHHATRVWLAGGRAVPLPDLAREALAAAGF